MKQKRKGQVRQIKNQGLSPVGLSRLLNLSRLSREEYNINGTKLCKKCNRELPIEKFGLSNGKPRSYCKECAVAYAREYAKKHGHSKKRDKEKQKEYQKKYREKHKDRLNAAGRKWHHENREHHILTSRLWKERHKERSLAKAREWKANHKERVKEIWAEWYAANREYAIARSNERRLLELSAAGTFTDKDIKRLLVEQECKCVYCGVELDGGFHADHIYSLLNYKYNGSENIQLLCQYHNLSKGAKDPIEYEESIGFLTEERREFLLNLREFIFTQVNSYLNLESENALMPVSDVGNQGAGTNDKKPGAKPSGTKPVNEGKPGKGKKPAE